MARPSCWNAVDWSAVTPPRLAVAPPGRSSEARDADTSALAVPMLSLEGVIATVADRWPRTVVMDDGPSTSLTEASESRRTGPRTVGTVSAASSLRVAGGVSLAM